jgi:hypothetical protein
MSGTSTQTAALSNLAQGLTRYETNTGKFMVNTASNSAAWKRIPTLTSGNGGKTLGVNSAGTDWEFKSVSVPTEYLTETEGDAFYHPLTTVDSAATENSTNLVTSGAMFTALADKHPSTTVDSVVVENSTNLITSGAMFTALADKHPSTTVDSAVVENSTNLITSGAMFTALAGKASTTDLTNSLAGKASTTDLTNGLAGKASTTALTTGLAGKASTTDLTTGLALKADATALTTGLAAKHPTIDASSRLNANLIGNGTVSDTEFGYLNGVTSAIQTQLADCLTEIPSEYLTQVEGEALFVSQSELANKQDLIQHSTRLSASLVGSSNTAPADAVTDAEFAYLSGLTGNIQGLLDLKADSTTLQTTVASKADKNGTSSITTSSWVRADDGWYTQANAQNTVGFEGSMYNANSTLACIDTASTGVTSKGWRIFTNIANYSQLHSRAQGAYITTAFTQSNGQSNHLALWMGLANNVGWVYIEKYDYHSNQYLLWQVSTGSVATVSSDDRIKYHEQPINSALSVVRQLQPKKYRKHARIMTEAEERAMEADPDAELPDVGVEIDGRTAYISCPKREAGFIAQDVLKIPELAHAVKQNAEGPMELQYNDVFTYAVAAIKELDALVSTLRTTVNQQTTQISSLQRRIQALES